MIDRTNVHSHKRTFGLTFYLRVRLGQFLGRALLLGQARGRALRLGQARGPGAAATSVTDQLTLVQKYVSLIGHL